MRFAARGKSWYHTHKIFQVVPAEERVMTVIDHVHVAAAGVEDGLQAREAHAEHRVQHNPQAAFPDGFRIHLVQDGIQVRVPRVDNRDDTGSLRFLEVHGPHIRFRNAVGLFLDG